MYNSHMFLMPDSLLQQTKKNCPFSHRIGGNRERSFLTNFSFSIAKYNVFDCQNQRIRLPKSI